MKKWIVRIVFIVLVLALVNDLGRYLIAMYTLDKTGRSLALEAGAIARQNPSANSGWPTAWQMAQENGIEIVSYQQDTKGVVAVARIYLDGTFIIGPVHALISKQPIRAGFPMEETFRSAQ